MTREQAINYLISRGFTNEQVGDVVRALTYEPTTKNNLAVDKEQLKTMIRGLTKWYVKRDNTEVGEPNTAVGLLYDDVMFGIDRLPSETPQEPRWIPVSERLPEEHICDDGFHEPSKSVLVQMKSGAMHTARYWSRYDERWLDLNYPTTDEVIAWMPLPKPYSEVEE